MENNSSLGEKAVVVFRWILVIPASILGWALASFLWACSSWLYMPEDMKNITSNQGFGDHWYFEAVGVFVWAAFGAAGGVFAGIWTAPSHKVPVGFSIAGVNLGFLSVLLLLVYRDGSVAAEFGEPVPVGEYIKFGISFFGAVLGGFVAAINGKEVSENGM